MKMMLNERIKAAMKHGKLSQTELAAKTGKTKGAVSQWLNGATLNLKSETSLAIADATGVSHVWLINGMGDMQPPKTRLKQNSTDDVVIEQYNTGGSMGHGLVLKGSQGAIKSWHVDKDWLRQNVKTAHTGTKNLCIVTGFGDSMIGMFNPGDPLLIDSGVTTCDYDGVYFFRIGNEGFIKRLQRVPSQGILVLSESAKYRDWTITEDMEFQVLGKVLTVWKSEQL